MVSESDIKMQEPEENENDGLPSVDAARDFYMKYDVRNRLGKGLSSVVHVCVEKFSGLSFAVKIMDITEHHINADGMNIVQQIHEEIRLLKRVEGHQYVIRLVEVFESETFIFIVFELCQNDDLFEYLSSNVNLSEKRCRAIMKQIFEAVYHCHQRNVLHRDIKPENVLLDKELTVKLTDFGLAKEIIGDERQYECVGTPGYLAPEVLEAGMCERNECNGYSFEVDAWACGVVLYTLLVGTPPFWHHRQLVMIRQIMRGTYSMDGAAWSAITAETKDLVRRLLVVDPKARLTIEEALQHEVFHAPRFTRVDGELLCIEAIYEEEDSVDASVIAPPSSSNETLNDNNVENAENKQKNRSRSVPLISIIGAKICAKKLSKKISKIQDARFNARATFKTAITCVRFLIRLLHIRTTPELLCLRQARINPYQIRSYRITIDREAFGLYHHWIKKGEGQDRAAVFQHFPKKDLKGKKTDQLLRPAL